MNMTIYIKNVLNLHIFLHLYRQYALYISIQIATNKQNHRNININNKYSQWLCPFIDDSCKACLLSVYLLAFIAIADGNDIILDGWSLYFLKTHVRYIVIFYRIIY